jgi:hypothetical protein
LTSILVYFYLLSAFGPFNWTFVSFRKRNKAGRRILRTLPFSVFIVFSTFKVPNGLQVVKAWNVVRASSDIAEFPIEPGRLIGGFLRLSFSL